MSGPAMPESVTIEEMEQSLAAPTPQKLSDIKLDGEGVPDELKGKSVAELVAQANGLREALLVSERARTQSDQMAALASRPVAAPVEQPKHEPELTDEQLAELHSTDPLKAIRYLRDQGIREASKNLESRMGSLFTSTAAGAEREARTKYKAEYEVLGSEISAMVAQIPNASSVLTTPEAFDNLIAIVRGRPGNFEKMTQHYAVKAGAPTLDTARATQVADAGVTLASSMRTPIAASVGALDATQLEIANKLGLTPQEYLNWSKV